MENPIIFEQSIVINTSATIVEQCFTNLEKMHYWLNPALRCEPWENTIWSTEIGAKSQFLIQIPLLKPVLISTVIERKPGVVVWEFEGFFRGRDRWEAQPQNDPQYQGTQHQRTLLINRFEFIVPNPIVAFGFNTFAAKWTKADMERQLQRLKRVAESIETESI
jgi:Polyketide cyclase / dehydrase and lipid transport